MLNIDTKTICDILDKSRQFQAKEDISFPEETADEDPMYVLADYSDDPVYQDAIAVINNLSDAQQATLVALMYLGRGDYSLEEWPQAYKFAEDEMTDHTGQYLLSHPYLAEYVEQAMDLLGINFRE